MSVTETLHYGSRIQNFFFFFNLANLGEKPAKAKLSLLNTRKGYVFYKLCEH